MSTWIRVLLFLLVLQFLPGVPVAGALGDQPGVVKGVVQSAEASAPLPGANVAVRRVSDSTLVDGTTTDSTGHFVVKDLPAGQYTVVASFVGYTSRSRTVTLSASDPIRTLDPFQLAGTAAQMEGATVSAERPFVTTKGSKRIYSFENSQVALAGKSAVDVLRDLPSLRVDAMDGSIQLRGNQSVSVHVNGKPVSRSGKALVQYLKSLSAANVKRVEVNTNPSARHDAEGTAGIINIVLKEKESEGWSGGFSASAGMGPRVEGSGNLGYKQGKWTLYGSYGYTQHEHDFTRDLLRRSTDDASTLLLDRTAEQTLGHGGHNFTFEADYALTPKTTLSLASTGTVRGGEQDVNTTTRRSTGRRRPSGRLTKTTGPCISTSGCPLTTHSRTRTTSFRPTFGTRPATSGSGCGKSRCPPRPGSTRRKQRTSTMPRSSSIMRVRWATGRSRRATRARTGCWTSNTT